MPVEVTKKARNFDVLLRFPQSNMSVETNWQTARPTIRERARFMLNNDRLSDVKFVATKSNGESESKQVIPAHKFILAIGSPVFEAMFYGELAETKDTIELPDCDHESLLELFRYMYSDEVNLSGSNVMGVLYLAKKYMVPSLTDKCMEYLKEKLDPSNVFIILPFAQKYEDNTLVDRCWNVIDEQTEAAVNSDGFEMIEESLLEGVITRDNLMIEEVVLFQAVIRWATKQCEKQGLVADGKVKRRIIGERAIKAIRFPLMTMEEFASVVIDTNLLTTEETNGLFKFFAIPRHSAPVEFPKNERRLPRIVRCERFGSVKGTWNYGLSKDYLGLTVDRDIKLLGISLFGSENKRYKVTLEVKNADNNTAMVSKAGTYPSNILPSKRHLYYGYEVLFDSAVLLKKNTRYNIEAFIAGPASERGERGFDTVKESGVTFTFSKIEGELASNGTSHNSGQFPGFLFSV